MNGSYTVPFLLSLIVHSTLIVYVTAGIDVPTINLEEAPSALEICVVGTDEIKQKVEKNRDESHLTPEGVKNPVEETKDIQSVQKIVKEARLVAPPPVEDATAMSEKSKTEIKNPQQDHQSNLGNSTVSHQSLIGAHYNMKDPSLVFNPSPRYPRKARQRGEEGMVILDVGILHNGDVDDIAIFSSSGYTLLDKAALDAVSDWRFTPAYMNGQSIAIRRKIPIVFKLR